MQQIHTHTKGTQAKCKRKPLNNRIKKKERKETKNYKISWKTKFRREINIYLLIINGLNGSIKRPRVAGWIKKEEKEPTLLWL